MLRPYTDACPSPIHLQVLPRDQPVRLQVSLARRLHDLRWQRRGRRVAVPLPLVLPAREVVAQRLLVEARLAPPWLVAIRRPEARRVGREDLVDHEQPLVGRRRGAELELCVRDDDAARPGVAPARPVRPGRNGSRAGTRATISSASADRKWLGSTRASCRNQKALSWVSTAPLCATGSRITTSNALTRSLATRSRMSRSTA